MASTFPVEPPPPVMPSPSLLREVLEAYPLYRKCKAELPDFLGDLPKAAIHMHCFRCRSEQTFNMVHDYHEGCNHARTHRQHTDGAVVRVEYRCTSCNEFLRIFLLKFDTKEKYVMKVGQEPPWDISLDSNLEKMLDAHAEYYKKGLICESQGYGIGAFSYYRRIIEEIIEQLLTEITDLIPPEEQERYLQALEKVKQTPVAQDKIQLVKDLLPSILRPDGINPLDIFYTALSKGIHSDPDEECIEQAAIIREALVFLVNQVIERKTATHQFTQSMRKLLDRKSES